MRATAISISAGLITLVFAPPVRAQRANPDTKIEAPKSERIAWFGTLKSARAEAARSQRPLLVISARPACRGVSGFW